MDNSMEHFIPTLTNNEDSSNILDKMSESKITIILPTNLEESDLQFRSDLTPLTRTKPKKGEIRKESTELKESAISSMKVSEYSRGENTFLKDLHKQLQGPQTAWARIELIPHWHTPKKIKKQ